MCVHHNMYINIFFLSIGYLPIQFKYFSSYQLSLLTFFTMDKTKQEQIATHCCSSRQLVEKRTYLDYDIISFQSNRRVTNPT